MNLGKSLKIALAIRGIKNKDLAEKISVDQQTVSNWINGRSMTNVNLERVCSLLEMPVSEFVALGEG